MRVCGIRHRVTRVSCSENMRILAGLRACVEAQPKQRDLKFFGTLEAHE